MYILAYDICKNLRKNTTIAQKTPSRLSGPYIPKFKDNLLIQVLLLLGLRYT